MRIYVLLITLALFHCSYPIKKNKQLAEDEFFKFSEVQTLNEAIFLAKDGRIEEAESIWIEFLEKEPNNKEALMNLVRMYYILEEYSLAKDRIRSWVVKNKIQLADFTNILQELNDEYRLEERGMYLEAVMDIPGYELYSYQELGNYFLYKKQLNSAEYYFQKILEYYPFHESALESMAEICLYLGRWRELIDYGKALHLTPGKKNLSYYYIGKGYYELKDFKTANEWLSKGPDSEKIQLDYFLLWRNAILSQSPLSSLEQLKKISKKVHLNVPEEKILPTTYPYGRELMDGLVR